MSITSNKLNNRHIVLYPVPSCAKIILPRIWQVKLSLKYFLNHDTVQRAERKAERVVFGLDSLDVLAPPTRQNPPGCMEIIMKVLWSAWSRWLASVCVCVCVCVSHENEELCPTVFNITSSSHITIRPSHFNVMPWFFLYCCHGSFYEQYCLLALFAPQLRN